MVGAISADGNTIITGSNSDENFSGAAFVFSRHDQAWTQVGAKLMASDGTLEAQFGFSVSISADGTVASIGGRADTLEIGATWVYVLEEGNWTQQSSKLVGSNRIGSSEQGYCTSISHDGNLVFVGGPHDNSELGAGWLFARVTEAPTRSPTPPTLAPTGSPSLKSPSSAPVPSTSGALQIAHHSVVVAATLFLGLLCSNT